MSYVSEKEYKIIPKHTFNIMRGCAGCGVKQTFTCKDKFRVNANKKRLDVWLIYGCEKCGHTYNLPIYERVNPNTIPQMEYKSFLDNDEKAVLRYGTDKSVFERNRAEIDWSLVDYELVPEDKDVSGDEKSFTENIISEKLNTKKLNIEKINIEKAHIENLPSRIKIYNPCDIPVRKDKMAAGILQFSRTKVNQLLKDGQLVVDIVCKNHKR